MAGQGFCRALRPPEGQHDLGQLQGGFDGNFLPPFRYMRCRTRLARNRDPGVGAGNKSIAFGDFSYYWIADRQGRTFKRLNELYATTGQVGFLASQRLDGKLILPEAIKVLQQKA